MLPLRDINPTRRVPLLTYGLILVNVGVFLWELSFSDEALFQVFRRLSVVPAFVTADPFSQETLLDLVRSMFFHGGWAHLLGNMLYLGIFGDNVEDRLGRLRFLLFYFAGGFVAALAQIAIDPRSQIPLVGASGAIAAVLGSYAIMFPGARVQGIILFGLFSQLTEMPALIVLGFWFILQLFNGVLSLGPATMGGGVAFFAHIGGFVAGVVITWLLTGGKPQRPVSETRRIILPTEQRDDYWDGF